MKTTTQLVSLIIIHSATVRFLYVYQCSLLLNGEISQKWFTQLTNDILNGFGQSLQPQLPLSRGRGPVPLHHGTSLFTGPWTEGQTDWKYYFPQPSDEAVMNGLGGGFQCTLPTLLISVLAPVLKRTPIFKIHSYFHWSHLLGSYSAERRISIKVDVDLSLVRLTVGFNTVNVLIHFNPG